MALCPCPCTTVGRLAPIPPPRERFEASSGAARVCGQQFFMRPGSPSCPHLASSPVPPVTGLHQLPSSPSRTAPQPSFPQSPPHFMKKLGRPRPHSRPTAQFLHKPEQHRVSAANTDGSASVLRTRTAAPQCCAAAESPSPPSPSSWALSWAAPATSTTLSVTPLA